MNLPLSVQEYAYLIAINFIERERERGHLPLHFFYIDCSPSRISMDKKDVCLGLFP